MPKIKVIFYQDEAGSAPVLNWLDRLPAKAQDKCRVRIERLRDLGHELRRPEGLGGRNYRMLYFFHGRVAAIVAHGLTKERQVPRRDIEEAIRRKRNFELDPQGHTYKEVEHAKK